jgi:hypothetical protein
MCGCALNASLATLPVRSIIRAKPAVVYGAPRSDVNTKGGLRLLLTMQPPEGAQFVAEDRMRAGKWFSRLTPVKTP